jgi:hypothetical protein
MNDSPFVGHTIANGTWENGTAKPAIEAGAPEVKDVQIGGSSSATNRPIHNRRHFSPLLHRPRGHESDCYCTVSE